MHVHTHVYICICVRDGGEAADGRSMHVHVGMCVCMGACELGCTDRKTSIRERAGIAMEKGKAGSTNAFKSASR